MTIKLLKQLIKYSYNNNMLNPKNVNRIANLLNRSDLKLYIRAIKIQERKLSVFIDTPMNNMKLKEKFKDTFPHKNIYFRNDPSLMLGARITADDMILDINLNNTLESIIKFVEEDYD